MARAYCEINIAGYRPTYLLQAMRVRQFSGKHDVALLTFAGLPAEVQAYRRGVPVRLCWGYPPGDLSYFYGYIDSRQESHTADPVTVLRVMGASWPMKNQGQRNWSGVSDSYLARWFARQYGFNAVVDRSAPPEGMLVQSNESDWAFLARRAEAIGYQFFVNETTMYFIDPAQVTATAVPLRVSRKDYTPGEAVTNLYSFRPDTGSVESADHVARVSRGVNPYTNTVVGLRSATSLPTQFDPESLDPAFTVFETDPVHSTAKAGAVLADTQRGNRFLVTAKAECDGAPRLTTSRLLQVDAEGENAGLWVVSGIEHSISGVNTAGGGYGDYRMSVQCGRDLVHTASVSLTRAPAPQVDTVLRNNLWQATTVAAA